MENKEINQQEDWLYSEIVKDHFFNPRNYLATEGYEADGFGTAGSPVCGDLMKVWIKVDSKTDKIISLPSTFKIRATSIRAPSIAERTSLPAACNEEGLPNLSVK